HREERHTRLSSDRLRQQGLSCPRRTDQQHAFWSGPAQAGVLLRILEKIHDLHQLVFGFVNPGDVIEGDLSTLLLVVAPRRAFANAEDSAPHGAALLGHPSEHPNVKADEQQGRTKPEKERREWAATFFDRLSADLDSMIDQE